MCAALQPGNFSAGVVIRGTIQEPGAILGVGITGTVFYTLYCYRQHSSAQDFGVGYCYRAHSLRKMLLLFTAQFAGQAAGFLQNLLLSSAQFGKIHGLFRVVIGGTFLLPGQNQGCYVRHISKNSAGFSPVVICSTFSGWGLLFGAQFTVCIISFLQRRVLLFTAHLAKNHCLACLSHCYPRHNSRKNFCWGCYSAHNSVKILLLPGRSLVSTRFQEFSPGVVIHSTI